MKPLKTPLALLLALTIPSVVSAAQLPQDQGAAGAWQKLLKLRTTASVMHTTAHPDDEHGGVLAQLRRGQGARVSLLTLNRGESGDNAIGSELFDGLGLIRTEELLRRRPLLRRRRPVLHHGDRLRVLEAPRGDAREVGQARTCCATSCASSAWTARSSLISRFQGNQRDGHGNHQAAGLITQEASRPPATRTMFPEQIAEGLRPWQPLKVYIGGVRENEDWTLRVDTGEYSPWLGDSYDNFARLGLSFQRSQNGGRLRPRPGPQLRLLQAAGVAWSTAPREGSELLRRHRHDASPGLFKRSAAAPAGARRALLAAIDARGRRRPSRRSR